MDKYIGTDIGIYHVKSVCDRKDTDGHKLYHVKCRYCEYESNLRLFDVKKPIICKHKTKTGRVIDFKLSWSNQRLESIFQGMVDRCYNNKNKSYRWYGEKGIRIFQGWIDNPKSFEEWALKNGYSDDLTIDRIESDKDYEPTNCQWIPLEDNARKSGEVNWITVDNRTLTGKQWAKCLGLGHNTINKYIAKYGIDAVQKLIYAMLKEPPSAKHRETKQTWFSVYDIQI